MFFGLLFILFGAFLLLWGLHYFGVLSVVGNVQPGGTTNG